MYMNTPGHMTKRVVIMIVQKLILNDQPDMSEDVYLHRAKNTNKLPILGLANKDCILYTFP